MDKQVGEVREFNFYKDKYEIREILENPDITMWWEWDSGLCPHCKNRITRRIKHDFHSIEILGIQGVNNENLNKKDICILGHSVDNKVLMLSLDKYNEVFAKSTKFKVLADKEQ